MYRPVICLALTVFNSVYYINDIWLSSSMFEQPSHQHTVIRTAQGGVADALRRLILLGKLPAGSRINQDAVAARYGVSRIPVREALHQLEAEGLVQIIPHRGALVSTLSSEELMEIYEMRDALESLSVRLAVPKISEDELRALEDLLVRMEGAADPARWLDLDSEFHTALYIPSGRKRLCNAISTLRRNTSRYLHIAVRSRDRIRLAQEEHRQILNAYRNRDAEEAAKALHWQLVQTRDFLLDMLGESSIQRDSEAALINSHPRRDKGGV